MAKRVKVKMNVKGKRLKGNTGMAGIIKKGKQNVRKIKAAARAKATGGGKGY